MRVIQQLIKSLKDVSIFNPEVLVSPACILWPDRERQWETIIPRLQGELPELLVLGDYAREKKTGPAIWLRCALAGKIPGLVFPANTIPIIYLPGVSRQDLRAVEQCPEQLKPLAELQYRGVIWSQVNAKDWTIFAFLKASEGGLGLDVLQDNETKSAIQIALPRLLEEDIENLRNKRLDKDYFNALLTGGDPVRDLIQWLDQGDDFRVARSANEWKAFVEICKSQFAFNPENEGLLGGAAKLAGHTGAWKPTWERVCEAPAKYRNIPDRIRACTMPPTDLYSDARTHGSWPQWNDSQETSLRNDLIALNKMPAHEAQSRLFELEKRHGERRELIWAELGFSPLAMALKHLAVMAETTKNTLAAGSVDDIVAGYSTSGWYVDDAVLRALAYVEKTGDIDAVNAAIRAIYLPWADGSARYMQQLIESFGYPGGSVVMTKKQSYMEGECVLFVDGLRFDVARQLAQVLYKKGCKVNEEITWAALPTVTSTGKPAVSPVRDKIQGRDIKEFEPVVAATGQPLQGHHFKKLLTDAGWQVLEKSESGNGKGNAWCEFGDIDHEAHSRGWKIVMSIATLLEEIRHRIDELFSAGWKAVRIVTDHGWLLMPGGLPKIELPAAVADEKWGRCALLKPGVESKCRTIPWFWAPDQHIAISDGIGCFRSGVEQTHSGVSLQECLLLQLTVTADRNTGILAFLEISDVVWRGMRCTVVVEGETTGLSLDIRTHPGKPASSVVVNVKPLKEGGSASVVVENEDLKGANATIVLLKDGTEVVAQMLTIIGGDQ